MAPLDKSAELLVQILALISHLSPSMCLVFSRKEPTSSLCCKPSSVQVFPDSPGYSIRHHFYTSTRSMRNNMGRPELCRNTCKQKNATKCSHSWNSHPCECRGILGRLSSVLLQPRAGVHGAQHTCPGEHSDRASTSGTELAILPGVSQKATGGHCLKNTPVLPCCLQVQGACLWHPAISSLPPSDPQQDCVEPYHLPGGVSAKGKLCLMRAGAHVSCVCGSSGTAIKKIV